MRRADVTVLIPTKNERENVGAFLASLPPDVELVAVDASDDGTAERILELRPKRTRVLRDPGNIPRARNAGAAEARTPWLLFSDADVAFAPGYFDRLAELAPAPRTGGIVGTKRTRRRYRTYHWLFLQGQRALHRLDIPAATGSNMLIAREAWERCGGFREELSCNEDSEIMWRVRRSGFEVELAPQLAVFARDHRRLERGAAGKMAHSLARCALLYLGWMPKRWAARDWGYWDAPAGPRTD
jgi:GT2 family glycosyltransferase